MSLAQYRGWLSESSVDKTQKKRLGWNEPEERFDRSTDLFSAFTAVPVPLIPKPDEQVRIQLDWPRNMQKISSLRCRVQTEIPGPWVDAFSTNPGDDNAPNEIRLGTFDRPTPVSYRVDATLANGETIELWGYFQVRTSPAEFLLPRAGTGNEAIADKDATQAAESVDLLSMIDVEKDAVAGD